MLRHMHFRERLKVAITSSTISAMNHPRASLWCVCSELQEVEVLAHLSSDKSLYHHGAGGLAQIVRRVLEGPG